MGLGSLDGLMEDTIWVLFCNKECMGRANSPSLITMAELQFIKAISEIIYSKEKALLYSQIVIPTLDSLKLGYFTAMADLCQRRVLRPTRAISRITYLTGKGN